MSFGTPGFILIQEESTHTTSSQTYHIIRSTEKDLYRNLVKIKPREKSLPVQQHLLLSFNIRKTSRQRTASEEEVVLLPVEHTTTYQPLICTTTCHVNKVYPSLCEQESTLKDFLLHQQILGLDLLSV